MKTVDLSHLITPDIPVYPGTDQPVMAPSCTLERDGFREKQITMFSHIGTHVDAPAHLIEDGKTLDQFPVSLFVGTATVLDCTNNTEEISLATIRGHEEQLRGADYALLHTGWDRHWGNETYFSGYPVLSLEAARWLTTFPLKGIGLDTISADKADTHEYEIHHIFLGQDIIIVENLTGLGGLPPTVQFSCLPLKFEDADGSPVRAVAMLQE